MLSVSFFLKKSLGTVEFPSSKYSYVLLTLAVSAASSPKRGSFASPPLLLPRRFPTAKRRRSPHWLGASSSIISPLFPPGQSKQLGPAIHLSITRLENSPNLLERIKLKTKKKPGHRNGIIFSPFIYEMWYVQAYFPCVNPLRRYIPGPPTFSLGTKVFWSLRRRNRQAWLPGWHF